ncbi:MAG: WD40 repeat domain-containing protein [Myxococcales bacterium]
MPTQDALQVIGGPDGDFPVPLNFRGAVSEFVSSDGHLLGVMQRQRMHLIDLRDRQVTLQLPGAHERSATFSADGRTVYFIDAHPLRPPLLISAWELRSPPARRIARDRPAAVGWSSDGRHFVAFSGGPAGPYTLSVGNAAGDLLASQPNVVVGLGPGFAISGDATRIVHSSVAWEEVVVRDTRSANVIRTIACAACVEALSRDGSLLATIGSGQVSLRDVATGTTRWTKSADGSQWQGIAFSDDDARVAWAEPNAIMVAETATGAVVAQLRTDNATSMSLAFSHDGGRIASAGDREILAWDWATRSLLWKRTLDAVSAVIWSLDDTRLILSHWGGEDVHDARSGELIALTDGGPQTTRSQLSPDLRHKIVKLRDELRLETLPPPDDGPPAERLAAILRDSGLELRGADLVEASR